MKPDFKPSGWALSFGSDVKFKMTRGKSILVDFSLSQRSTANHHHHQGLASLYSETQSYLVDRIKNQSLQVEREMAMRDIWRRCVDGFESYPEPGENVDWTNVLHPINELYLSISYVHMLDYIIFSLSPFAPKSTQASPGWDSYCGCCWNLKERQGTQRTDLRRCVP